MLPFLLLLQLWSSSLAAAEIQPLEPSKIRHIKSGPCVFIHTWATWCTTCVQELPSLISFLNQQKKITKVVIDLSDPFVQKNFSKKYITHLSPGFITYVKPKISDSKFMSYVTSQWNGGLPYNALYSRGKLRKEWTEGVISYEQLSQDFAAACDK